MIKSIAISGLLVLCGAVQMASAQFYADMVLYNGQILTANSDDAAQFSIAQAVAIYDGKFRAVGSNDEVLKHSGPATQRIDLKGKTVLPGIIDTHRHVSPRDASSAAGRQDPTVHWTTKADGLAQLRTIALGKKPGEWIIPGTTGPEGLGDPPLLYQRKVLRQDIDPITPNNPVFIVWKATNRGILNTVALNMLLERYPDGLPGMDKDASGKFTGYMEGLAVYTFKEEFEYWAPFEVGAPVLKARLEQTAADGITTVSTWVNPYAISVYNLLDRKGELPVRIAYSHLGYKGVADPDPHVRRMGNLVGLGTDSLWMAAMAVMSVDGTVSEGRACLSKEYPREHRDFPAWLYQPWGPNGRCQLTDPMYSDREMILAANRYGIRIARTHVGGDRSTDEYLAVMEEAAKQSPGVAERRNAIDHCRFFSDEQARRAMKLGIVMNCNTSYIQGGDKGEIGAIAAIYGKAQADDIVVPMRRLIDVGLRPGTEIAGDTFGILETLVTRKDTEGKVWGPQQKISRREALLTITRWNARYTLREDRIGSIERGKLADLTVLDRDFLTVPEDDISEVKVLMTILAGKPTYIAASFAPAEGLPVVGYQGPKRGGGGGD